MYFHAFEFRMSTYFISLFSQAVCLVDSTDDLPSEQIYVVRPEFIEIPRSMANVVTNWNLPMHNWLKNRIFSLLFLKFPTIQFIALKKRCIRSN